VAKECQNYGQRVQYSVFECVMDPAQWTKLKNKLESVIDREQDSLRYYYLGANFKRRVEHVGAKPVVDIEAPIIV
jgi:CRISPR-associated protein Cas2